MIVVIDYGMGNTGSVVRMLKKVGRDAKVVDSPEGLRAASKLILPGVGAFDNAMEKLEQKGFRSVLDDLVMNREVPLLGICLGMQLLFERSEEGKRPGLGWMAGDVKRFVFQGDIPKLPIPHMGWTDVDPDPKSRLFAENEANPRFYFVHSYHAIPKDPSIISGTADYGYRFCCAVEKWNLFGVQFHPEKSHKYGLRLLQNFASLN